MLKLLNSLAMLQLVINAESELDFKDDLSLTNSTALGKFLSFSIVSLIICKMGIIMSDTNVPWSPPVRSPFQKGNHSAHSPCDSSPGDGQHKPTEKLPHRQGCPERLVAALPHSPRTAHFHFSFRLSTGWLTWVVLCPLQWTYPKWKCYPRCLMWELNETIKFPLQQLAQSR